MTLLALSGALLVGCSYHNHGAEVGSHRFYQEIRQEGLMPAPSGPRGVGPQLEAGEVGAEASVAYLAVSRPSLDADRGASGAVWPTTVVRGEGTVGVINWLQIGIAGSVAPGLFGRSLAADVSASGWGWLLAGSLHLRGHFGWHWFATEPFVEGEGTTLGYRQTVTRTETSTGSEGDASWTDVDESERSGLVLIGRTGAAFMSRWRGIEVRQGAYVQNLPWLYGSWEAEWGCTVYEEDTHCSDRPDAPPDLVTIVVPGAFVSVAVPLSPRWVLSGAASVVWVSEMAMPGATVSLLGRSGRLGRRGAGQPLPR